VEIFAFLESKKNSIENAAKQFGVNVPSKHLGFTIEEWQSDIKCRINGLQIKAKRDELASLEARVNALVSPEQRREIELQKLVAEIG
jgi:phage portal protein BeeE